MIIIWGKWWINSKKLWIYNTNALRFERNLNKSMYLISIIRQCDIIESKSREANDGLDSDRVEKRRPVFFTQNILVHLIYFMVLRE